MFRPTTAFALLAVTSFTASAAGQGVNLALNGTASQSTTDFGGVATRGNDGNTDGVYNNSSVTHTQNLTDSFWEVDLGGTFALDRILLHNRSDCCGLRLSNFRVSAYAGATEVFSEDYYVGGGSVPQGGIETVLLPPGTSGDRVRVRILGMNNDGNGFLSLAEVEIFEAIGIPYCLALPNSVGQLALITGTGSSSIAANDLTLRAGPTAPGAMAQFFYGPDQIVLPFGGGFRCVGRGTVGIFRISPVLIADAAGIFTTTLDVMNPSLPAGTITTGSTWNFQGWYSDPGLGFNLTDATEITFVN